MHVSNEEVYRLTKYHAEMLREQISDVSKRLRSVEEAVVSIMQSLTEISEAIVRQNEEIKELDIYKNRDGLYDYQAYKRHAKAVRTIEDEEHGID